MTDKNFTLFRAGNWWHVKYLSLWGLLIGSGGEHHDALSQSAIGSRANYELSHVRTCFELGLDFTPPHGSSDVTSHRPDGSLQILCKLDIQKEADVTVLASVSHLRRSRQ